MAKKVTTSKKTTAAKKTKPSKSNPLTDTAAHTKYARKASTKKK